MIKDQQGPRSLTDTDGSEDLASIRDIQVVGWYTVLSTANCSNSYRFSCNKEMVY